MKTITIPERFNITKFKEKFSLDWGQFTIEPYDTTKLLVQDDFEGDVYDCVDLDYEIDRKAHYPRIEEQLDKLWHDIEDGKLDKTGSFYTSVLSVKTEFPKE